MRRCKHTSGQTRLVDIGTWLGKPARYVETEDWQDWAVARLCEYRQCTEWCCPVCGCNKYGGVGPPLCPCDDTVPYHDMRRKPKVAVKPSLGTNGRRRRKARRV